MCLKLATPGLNTYVTKIKITTDEKIQGLFNVTFDNVPTIQASGTTDDAEKTVVLKTLTNISTAHDFFIPLPENTYSSLEIKIYTADGKVCTKTMNTTNNNNHLYIHRSQYTVVDLTTGTTLNFTGATGAKGGYFSVATDKKIQFSQGNLQYRAKEPSPGTGTNIWKFADNQYDHCFPNNISSDVRVDYYNNTSTQWIDLFYWGSTCCIHSNNSTNDNYPWNLPGSSSSIITNQDITRTDYDWGSFCDITNGGDGEWYTMTQAEWEYLFNHGQWAKAKVCNVNGIILLPDYWVCPIDITPLTCGTSTQFSSNTVNSDRWSKLETSGAVFLPITGELYQYIINHTTNGYYWTSSYYNENYANRIIITNSSISSSTSDYAVWRSCFAVRLVTE